MESPLDVLNPEEWRELGEEGPCINNRPWRVALPKFLAAGFSPGDLIKHEWFFEALGIVQPKDCTEAQTALKSQLVYCREVSELRRELLEEHQIALRNVLGEGYEIVHPHEQTAWAEERVKAELGKAARTARARLTNVQFDQLTDTQKKENLDAQARLSFFRKEARKALA